MLLANVQIWQKIGATNSQQTVVDGLQLLYLTVDVTRETKKSIF